MTYILTEQENHKIEIAGSLQPEIVDRERQSIVRSIKSRAKLPGFRDGKAPESLIRARFADDIGSELEEHLSQLVWQEVMEAEKELQPLTTPKVRDLKFADDGSFELIAELEVRPSYELPDLDQATLPVISLDIIDGEVATELEQLREQQAVWEPVEDEDKEAVDGMLVEADLIGQMEDSDQDPYEEKDARLVLGSDGVPPVVNEALQGAKVGDERIAAKVFPEDDENKDRAGKTVNYTIKVKALKQKVLPEIDDELAKTLGLEDLDELKERVREALERRKVGERREEWRRSLLDQLSEDIDLNSLPSSLVQNAVNERLNRFAYEMAMQGAGPQDGKFDWQELSAKAEPAARRHVADNLVLEQLAMDWETSVPESEVDAYIAAEASQHGIPPAEHKANLAAEEKLESSRHAARMTSVVDEMIRRAGGEVE
jgi:trigger factor